MKLTVDTIIDQMKQICDEKELNTLTIEEVHTVLEFVRFTIQKELDKAGIK